MAAATAAAPPAIDHNAKMHAVLTMCGITIQATRATIIMGEGFTSIANFRYLKGDKDVADIARHLTGHTQAEGHVNLGTIVTKRL